MRYNAVVKQKYRKYYNRAVLNQLWNGERLGFSIKQCIELGARIIQNEIRNVLWIKKCWFSTKKFDECLPILNI